ncbi:unnamed protein product [Penicillium glandicola]
MALLRLPNEILLAIADHLRSLNDINAFAQTNHRCYAVLNRQLYVYAITETDKPGFLWAVENDRSKTLQNFLDVGAITGSDAAKTIQTPLNIAARRGYPEIVTLLITYGANVYGDMKNHCQAALAEAMEYGQVEVAKVLFNNGINLQYVYGDGKRPLHLAAQSNNAEIIKFLSSHNVDRYHLDRRSTSALHIAALGGKENTTQALLDCGFNPNFVDDEAKAHKGIQTRFPQNNWTVISALLQHGADPYLKNRHGFMPLWIAAFLNRTVVVGSLLEYGVNPHGLDANGNAQEPMPLEEFRVMVREDLADFSAHSPQLGHEGYLNCCTPLCIAAFLGCTETVKLLLDHGADPNATDPNGEMPLHLAVRDKDCVSAELLIEKGACLESRDCHDQTPLSWALSYGGHEMIELLRNNGASAASLDWEGGVDPVLGALVYGHTTTRTLLPPHIVDWADAYTYGHQNSWLYGRHHGDWIGGESHDCEIVVEWLLEEGSKVDSRDYIGRTVLHQAAFQNCEETIKLLLKRGADPMSKDSFGQIPLHMACAPFFSEDPENAFKILLEAGSDPDSKDINGETSVHMAARAGFSWGIQVLAANGLADFMARNNDGNTALHVAVLSGLGEMGDETIKELRKAGLDPSLVNNAGQSAMDLARELGEETMIYLTSDLSEESDESESSEDPEEV